MRTIQHHTHIIWTYFVLIGYRHSKLDCVVLCTQNPMGMFTLEIANWRSCDMNTRIRIGLHVFRIILLVTQPTKETETGWSPNFWDSETSNALAHDCWVYSRIQALQAHRFRSVLVFNFSWCPTAIPPDTVSLSPNLVASIGFEYWGSKPLFRLLFKIKLLSLFPYIACPNYWGPTQVIRTVDWQRDNLLRSLCYKAYMATWPTCACEVKW